MKWGTDGKDLGYYFIFWGDYQSESDSEGDGKNGTESSDQKTSKSGGDASLKKMHGLRVP